MILRLPLGASSVKTTGTPHEVANLHRSHLRTVSNLLSGVSLELLARTPSWPPNLARARAWARSTSSVSTKTTSATFTSRHVTSLRELGEDVLV